MRESRRREDEQVLPTDATTGGGWLSHYARTKKLEYFLSRVPEDARILEVGCGDGTAKRWAEARGWQVLGVDLRSPADIVGDVNEWRRLGLQQHSFDVILAFEVVEHGDLAEALRDLLKPGGLLMLTTPVPRMDWACKLMESAGILQRRTGEHTHLVDIRRYPGFRVVERRVRGLVSQWGILTPAEQP
jgi:2-polyprenyl-3-methyl-5-hydroxy-6-metoxy-1,4-benzoquinol methylase